MNGISWNKTNSVDIASSSIPTSRGDAHRLIIRFTSEANEIPVIRILATETLYTFRKTSGASSTTDLPLCFASSHTPITMTGNHLRNTRRSIRTCALLPPFTGLTTNLAIKLSDTRIHLRNSQPNNLIGQCPRWPVNRQRRVSLPCETGILERAIQNE